MKPLVLIVEDEAALVTMLRYNLEKEGFAVCEAGDGEEALVQIAERKPDVVLLDWMLPLVSGIEVCRQIRRSPSSRTLPVVMLTARGEEGDRVRGLNSGADDYVVKPFSPTELIARLRAVMRRAQPTSAEDVLRFADGRALYFAGDTNVFSDMQLIEQLYHPELAIIPIGDLYTMSPYEAAAACKLLRPAKVIPMHFGTFPALTGTPEQLREKLAHAQTEVWALEPGKTVKW